MTQLRLPPPPRDKNYLVCLMDAQLVDVAGKLEGAMEDELTAAIEKTVREFIATRPVRLYLPKGALT